MSEQADPETFDVVVIGGGITGCGTFRDLALQGFKVLLVEQNQFCSGASGALTRIAQGGFRYLERGDIVQVAKSVRERNLLVRNAGAHIRPIRVVIPTASRCQGLRHAILRFLKLDNGRSLPGSWVLGIGVLLYEILGQATRTLPRGGIFSARQLRQRYRGINPYFQGAAFVFEGAIDSPEEIAAELRAAGLAAGVGSQATEQLELQGLENGVLKLYERRTNRWRRVKAKVVVNAAGAWANRVTERLGVAAKLVSGVAGTHIFLENRKISDALAGDLLFFEHPQDKRLCCTYAIGDQVLLGATEIPVADPDQSAPAEHEATYLLEAMRHLLPEIPVEASQIVGHLHGVRPLLVSDLDDVTSRSRDHRLVRAIAPDGLPVVSIVGGKWTTFRAMAEDATNQVLAITGRKRQIGTDHLAISATGFQNGT